ncbi:hypothetical protein BCR36DRAFT_317216 [Piromyces finnis]|uniref:Uncharacterized protein n=1 Tax=Piromyces finnis TaxID=1754191 RepID=A0A1Y1VM68_9FUNG|nr:hypothetical protein BCR36DRAFT_317216 [Piromyces finnis]|eukprot:ORX59245.1 hypothetical protein BCR36DRAFT_317216 [Piromyces finnis]
MQYDINKILDRIETTTLGDVINERKKDKFLPAFNINFLDNLINFTTKKVKAGSCFEINGSTCTGKTEILIHIISTLLINNLIIMKGSENSQYEPTPPQPNNGNIERIILLNKEYIIKYIPQCETIYYFDCDNRFNFGRLVKILKFQLLKKLKILQGNEFEQQQQQQQQQQQLLLLSDEEDNSQINSILKMCLKYFNIIKPQNTFSLLVSLMNLKDLYPTLLYIMIDSISMFYYIDIEEESIRRNVTEKKKSEYILSSSVVYRQLNKLLKLLTQKYKITLFLTTRNYKSDYGFVNNDDQIYTPMNINEDLINTLYRSSIPGNHHGLEYFIGLQNNKLVFKSLVSNFSYYSVFQKDLIDFKLLLSRHPESLLELPEELNSLTNNVNNKSKFVGCFILPTKTNILEFEINDNGIF